MKVTKIYTGSDKESHFSDAGEIVFQTINADNTTSNSIDAKTVSIQLFDPSQNNQWFESDEPYIYSILLDGEQEIQVTDGEKRVFSSGDVLLIEASKGRGYCIQNVGQRPSTAINITLE